MISDSFRFLQVFVLTTCVSGHMRWEYPPPRSDKLDISTAPCGDQSNNFTNAIQIQPGTHILKVTYHSFYFFKLNKNTHMNFKDRGSNCSSLWGTLQNKPFSN